MSAFHARLRLDAFYVVWGGLHLLIHSSADVHELPSLGPLPLLPLIYMCTVETATRILRNTTSPSVTATLLYIPTNSARRWFLYLLTIHRILCFFDSGHVDNCEMVSHHSLDLHFCNSYIRASFRESYGFSYIKMQSLKFWSANL